MKKIAIAAAVSAALSAGVAQAYQLGTFSQALVVPNVIQNGPGDTTVVGLINASNRPASVYWSFYDVDSNHAVDGCIPMTDRAFAAFDWSAQRNTIRGVRGYLVFASVLENDGGRPATCLRNFANAAVTQQGQNANAGAISANAFQVNTAAQDVAYVPVFPATTQSFNLADRANLGLSLAGNAPDAFASRNAGGNGDSIYMRFFVDHAAGGNGTSIVIWSNGPLATGLPQAARAPMRLPLPQVCDTQQNCTSGNIAVTNAELNVIDAEGVASDNRANIEGIGGINDGFVILQVPSSATVTTAQVVSYSVVSSTAFGAVQTLLNAVLPTN